MGHSNSVPESRMQAASGKHRLVISKFKIFPQLVALRHIECFIIAK